MRHPHWLLAVGGSFRHVPVLDAAGPPRLLDLVRCLFDVIAMLERAQARLASAQLEPT